MGDIVIDHHYKKNNIGAIWLGIWVDAINGYVQSEVVYFILEFNGPCILYTLHGY